MKIGIFTDSHYCTKDIVIGTRRPLISEQKLRDAVREFRKQGVELIICLGDLVDSDDSSIKNKQNLKLISSILIDSGIESYCCMGNHDADLFDREEFLKISELKIAPAIIEKNDKLLVLLDANYSKDGIGYKKGNIDWTDTMIPKKQVDRLEKVLCETDKKEIYIFVHQNLDSALSDEYTINNAAEIRNIFKNSGKIRAVYQGHFHAGALNFHDEIPYITIKAMCEGRENAFEIIEI